MKTPKQSNVEKAADINDFGRNSFVAHTTGLKERIQKMTKLKPCPFCNGEANLGNVKYSDNCEEVKLNNRSIGYFGQCIQCSATMQQGLSYETKEIAINKWNRRFVTKDKNGKDVFAGDCCYSGNATGYIHWSNAELAWMYEWDDKRGDTHGDTHSVLVSKVSNIELIEDKKNV